jgi:putative FmdB family regulatory protein
MPTYDYKCDACGNTWEQFQPMSAAPTKRCPKCGKNKARRLIGTGAGLIFKGSGFYITDYRDAGYKEKAKAKAETGGGDASAQGGDAKAGGDAKSGGDATAPSKDDQKPESKPATVAAEKKAASKPAAKTRKSK